MTDRVFRFKTNPDSLSAAEYGIISADEIMRMSSQEFLVFKNRLANVRRRTRYDTAVYEKAVIAAGTTVDLFRAGIGDRQKFATSNAEFLKTRAHTNMTRKGEFEQGSLVIITDIVAKKFFTSGLATTVTDGIVTNSKALAAVPTNDPTLNLLTWIENIELAYKEGEDDKVVNLLSKFTQNDGISGFMGASVGGVAQNFAALGIPLPTPRVLEGGEDFSLQLRHHAAFDTSTATGIDQVVAQRVELETIEVIQVRP
jgi:hypothetical protein